MHQNSPARDRLISDSRRALQFRGDSRPHSFLIIRGDIIDRHCAILSCSYWIKSSPRRAIVAIRKVHPLFFPRPTSMVNLESAVQFCRAKHLPCKFIFAFQEMPEANRSECFMKVLLRYFILLLRLYLYCFIILHFHWDILWQPIFEKLKINYEQYISIYIVVWHYLNNVNNVLRLYFFINYILCLNVLSKNIVFIIFYKIYITFEFLLKISRLLIFLVLSILFLIDLSFRHTSVVAI